MSFKATPLVLASVSVKLDTDLIDTVHAYDCSKSDIPRPTKQAFTSKSRCIFLLREGGFNSYFMTGTLILKDCFLFFIFVVYFLHSKFKHQDF